MSPNSRCSGILRTIRATIFGFICKILLAIPSTCANCAMQVGDQLRDCARISRHLSGSPCNQEYGIRLRLSWSRIYKLSAQFKGALNLNPRGNHPTHYYSTTMLHPSMVQMRLMLHSLCVLFGKTPSPLTNMCYVQQNVMTCSLCTSHVHWTLQVLSIPVCFSTKA